MINDKNDSKESGFFESTKNIIKSIKKILGIIDETETISFEISEFMKEVENSIKALEEIADIPLIISIDDFGTGYSSLSYLHKLPATIIKIDYGFTSQLDKDENMRKIVASTIKLGHDLGMKVVAEGVETQKEEDILKELHCDIGQGYLYSAAMPASDVLNWRNNETI